MLDTELAWHSRSAAAAAEALATDIAHGLGDAEVQSRLAHFGANRLEEGHQTRLTQMLARQFANILIVILLIAALVSVTLGEWRDAVVILIIVLLNAIIGTVQEYRAEHALAALKRRTGTSASVRRAGQWATLPTERLVPGDIVALEAGNIVPCDLRLAEAVDFEVGEAMLTGESLPVQKQTDPLEASDLPLGDRSNMAYKGTHVTRGGALGIAVATGMHTELGNIAALLESTTLPLTPLQKRLDRFGKRLAAVIALVALSVFVAGVLRGESLVLMFLTAVSMAVAAIPEALPAVVTIALALGAQKMSQRHALMRRLPAVETLGSVTYICADKTGTLTRNEMRVETLFVDAQQFGGDFAQADFDQALWSTLAEALALNNDVSLAEDGSLRGEPTELALYQAVHSRGFDKSALQATRARIGELAFSSERRRMSTLHRQASGVIAYCKGAPEAILPLCRNQLTAAGPAAIDREALGARAQAMATDGYRVLAVACRRFKQTPAVVDSRNVERELTFLGLVGLLDPPRDDVLEAVADCRSAGIAPVMITGDHPGTASAIARRLGIVNHAGGVLTGAELDALDDTEFAARVRDVRVYARVTPAQKLRIVQTLQQHGEWVAMTGDGVNDAPALKQADIGIAMGKKGTDVAREASDMVLVDDHFATIVGAIREGRRIFDNVRKFIKYTMTSNSGEIWTLFLAPFLGLPLPLLPIQILWVNLVTDGLPGLALAVEPRERGIMQRPPRPPAESIFSHGMWQHILIVGLLIGALSLSAQAWAYHSGSQNWQTVVFTVLTFAQLVQALVIRSERESLFSLGLTSNLPLLGAVLLTVGLQLLVIYVPFLNQVFHTSPLSALELSVCFTLPLCILLAVETEKWLVRRGYLYRQKGPPASAGSR